MADIYLVVLGPVVLVVGLRGAVVALARLQRQRQVLRSGVRLNAEVVGDDGGSHPSWRVARLTSAVAYQIDGRRHEGLLANRTGRLPIGSGVEVMVDPRSPYEPFVAYGSTLLGALGAGVFGVVVGLVGLLYGISTW